MARGGYGSLVVVLLVAGIVGVATDFCLSRVDAATDVLGGSGGADGQTRRLVYCVCFGYFNVVVVGSFW